MMRVMREATRGGYEHTGWVMDSDIGKGRKILSSASCGSAEEGARTECPRNRMSANVK